MTTRNDYICCCCSDDKDSVQGWSDYELLDEPDCVEVKPRYMLQIFLH